MIYYIKFIYSWVLPPAIFVLMLLMLAWRSRRRSRMVAPGIMLVAVLMYASSIQPVSERLLHGLEYRADGGARQNSGTSLGAGLPEADVIVILGGGATVGVPLLPGWGGQLSDVTAQRLLAGYALHRISGLPILVSSGEVFAGEGNEARIMRDILISLGMDAGKILLEDLSLNTTENARFSAEILKQQGKTRPLLVTSAFHMPRSQLNFSQAGVKVVPYPVGFYSNQVYRGNMLSWIPSFSAMRGTGLAMKEYLGLMALGEWRFP